MICTWMRGEAQSAHILTPTFPVAVRKLERAASHPPQAIGNVGVSHLTDTSEGGGEAARPAAHRFKSKTTENRTPRQARTGHYSATQMKPWRGPTQGALTEARKRCKGSAG
jgi:hypothetical protein